MLILNQIVGYILFYKTTLIVLIKHSNVSACNEKDIVCFFSKRLERQSTCSFNVYHALNKTRSKCNDAVYVSSFGSEIKSNLTKIWNSNHCIHLLPLVKAQAAILHY